MIKYGQLLLLALAILVIGCDGDDPVSTTPQVTAITITGDNEITVGATTTLTATVTEDEAPQTVTWASSDASIATINESGLVTAVAEGGVTITATSTEATNISATFAITVTVPVDPTAPAVNSVSLTGVDSVFIDEFTQLTATVDAVNGAVETVTWSTSDAAIAVVNPLGFVTGVSEGTVTITATSTFDSEKTASFEMRVVRFVYPFSEIYGYRLSGQAQRMIIAELNAYEAGDAGQTDVLGSVVATGTNTAPLTQYGWTGTLANINDGVIEAVNENNYASNATDGSTTIDVLGTTPLSLSDDLTIEVIFVTNWENQMNGLTITLLDVDGNPTGEPSAAISGLVAQNDTQDGVRVTFSQTDGSLVTDIATYDAP
jgi:hypothetical protein